jgi:predicted ATP-binding protein involved in virulence
MYLKRIILENVGPLGFLDISLPFDDDSKPKPVVFVGENGSGKSILLSYITNALLSAEQELFDNCEVEKGKVYKYRSQNYIKVGSQYSFGKVEFEEDLTCVEWQLNRTRQEFEKEYEMAPIHKEWNDIPENETNLFKPNFNSKKQKLKTIYNQNCILYFPPNRFEEPAWLNWDNLHAKASFTDIKRLTGFLNRKIINYSPLRENQNWLLDILYDRNVLELKIVNANLGNQAVPEAIPIFTGYEGESTNIYNTILTLLKIIIQKEGNLRFGIGKRSNRKVELMFDEKLLIPNIFQLSTGETALLNLFLTILRDFDLGSSSQFVSPSEVRGIVLIDEIDIHLHSIHQRNILPKLISLFPKIQFVVTSHSPLFVLGLEDKLGSDGISIIQLPNGVEITSEQFGEFKKAFTTFKNTKKYDDDIRTEIEKSHKPIIFVEGDYDIRYLQKAAELHEKTELLGVCLIKDSNGFGNINKVSKHFNSKLAEVTPQKIILLYDCDIQKNPTQTGNVYCRVMPTIEVNPVKKGIENLFSQETLSKAIAEKIAFIDITPQHEKIVRGENEKIPETWEANKDEKNNLCNWLCENGTIEDFSSFLQLFEIIEEILN